MTPGETMRLLAEAAELLDGARCSFADPALRMEWGRHRRDFLDAVRELVEEAAAEP